MGQVLTTPTPTIADCIDRYQRDGMGHLAPTTHRDYVRHLGHLRRFFGHIPADELTPRMLAEWMDVPKGKIQRNRQLAVLSAVYQKAIRRYFLCKVNPCKEVDRHESRPRDRYITDEEYEQLKAIAPLRVELAMELALLTGQRQGDIIGMQWSQIQDMAILIRQGKTGKKLGIQITPALEAVLDRCWNLPNGGKDGGAYMITRSKGGRYTSTGFRALWQRTSQRWKRLGNSPLTYHDLRAKSASDSGTLELAMQRLGHTSMALTRRVYDRGLRIVAPLR